MRENWNSEKELIFKMSDAKLYGIWCDCENGPLDPDYSYDGKIGCQWDDVNTKNADAVIEWLIEYYDGNDELTENISVTLNEISEMDEDAKWSALDDLRWQNPDIIPDEFLFYHYEMVPRIVGLSFTLDNAKEIKNSIDSNLNPRIEILSRHEFKGQGELKEIAEYFRNKAKEIF